MKRRLKHGLKPAAAGMAVIAAATLVTPAAHALVVPLTLTNIGPDPDRSTTTVFRAELTGIGLTKIESLSIADSDSGIGGSAGIFSGFDLDAVFLDIDGDLTTIEDRIYGSTFDFSAGTTRPTSNPNQQPTSSHPGPTFGSLSATAIDFATATPNAIDGVSIPNVSIADGFLSLGDGGSLRVGFGPPVVIPSSLYLMLGEVGTSRGELVAADVFVSDDPIVPEVPAPATLALLGMGLAAMGSFRRRRPVRP